MLDERALEWMPPPEAFDRRDARPLGMRDRHETRIDRHAVDEDRARAALSLAAPLLRPREPAVLADDVEQPLERMYVEFRAPAR